MFEASVSRICLHGAGSVKKHRIRAFKGRKNDEPERKHNDCTEATTSVDKKIRRPQLRLMRSELPQSRPDRPQSVPVSSGRARIVTERHERLSARGAVEGRAAKGHLMKPTTRPCPRSEINSSKKNPPPAVRAMNSKGVPISLFSTTSASLRSAGEHARVVALDADAPGRRPRVHANSRRTRALAPRADAPPVAVMLADSSMRVRCT